MNNLLSFLSEKNPKLKSFLETQKAKSDARSAVIPRVEACESAIADIAIAVVEGGVINV